MYATSFSAVRNDWGPAQSIGTMLLSPQELVSLFPQLPGAYRLMAELLYATGMRLEELLQLRVRDVEGDGWCVVVREEDALRSRRLRLPRRLRDALSVHLERRHHEHQQELARGGGEASGGDAEAFPGAGRRWCRQFVFPAADDRWDPVAGRRLRCSLEPPVFQSVLGEAARKAGLNKPVHAQALRHAFTLQYLTRGRPLPDLQRLLGHANLATTYRYVEVLQAAQVVGPKAGAKVGPVVHAKQAIPEAVPLPVIGLRYALAG